MKNKLLLLVLHIVIILHSTLLNANNSIGEDFQFSALATGNTTGHIGDLTIANKTTVIKNFIVEDYIIPPENDRQGFVVLNNDDKKIEILPNQPYTYKLYGYCISAELLPPIEGTSLPDFKKWYPTQKFDNEEARKWKYTAGNPKTLNFKTQMPIAASIIVDAVNKMEDQYNTQRITLEIPELYPGNSLILGEALIQQAVWQFTSTIQGKSYTFNDFEQGILKQREIENWLNINGTDDEVVDNKSFSKKNYFNFQCQKLWKIITKLNLSANPKVKNILPKWDIETRNLNPKFIRFQYNWRDIALTGFNFKPNEVEEKKLWPYYAAGGAAIAVITTTAILLTREKGCTDPTACNYNEDAKKDDGSCEYIMGCTIALSCNYNPEACIDDGSCMTPPCSEIKCDFKQGVIRFNECGVGYNENCEAAFPYYLIEYNNELLDPSFDLIDYCINGYEGQPILFDFHFIPSDQIEEDFFTCQDIATPIYLTCLEIDTKTCATEPVTFEDSNCDCDQNQQTFMRTENGELLEFYLSNRCDNQNIEIGITYYVDYGISNFQPNCSVANEMAFVTCIERSCPDPCDPNCLKTGTIRFNENCMTDIVRTCTQVPHYLIEYNGELFSPILNDADNCFVGYEGQQVMFNYTEVPENEVDDSYLCSDIATPINITCFETIRGDCTSEQVKVVGINCSCNGRYTAFFENTIGETLLFLDTNCETGGEIFNPGDVYKVDYFDAVTQPGCDAADKTVVLTCYEKVVSFKNDETETNSYILKKLTPFIENSFVTILNQNSEYPNNQLMTTVLGINYYQPLTPTIFIQNQTIVGNPLLLTDLYLFNNKTTLNAKNRYFPIYYGLGLNNQQVTDFISSGNLKTDVIWNLGLNLQIFEKLQLEAEVFKSFNIDDSPNINVRMIYRRSNDKE